MADWHVTALAVASRTTIAACVDPIGERAAALAAWTGGVACSSLAEAIAVGVDAAAIIVPHNLHETLAVEALDADLHVALEKPMAPELDACERILAAAARTDRVFMVTENSQYWPEVLAARDVIASGAIGEVLTARSWYNSPPPPEFYAGERPWRFEGAVMGGGAALDTGPHWLRPLRMVLGEIDEVVATTQRTWKQMDGESLVRSLCRFRSGVVASFDVMLATGPVAPMPYFQFTGTSGEVLVTADGETRVFDGADPNGTVVGRGGYRSSLEGVWLDFEAAVLDGTPLAATAEHSLGEIRAAHAIIRSAESHSWEPVW